MKVSYGAPKDIEGWMRLVTRVRWNFPGLETRETLEEHKACVLRFMDKRQAICVREKNEIIGVMLFSRNRNRICCLAVDPDHRRCGTASMLMDEALGNLDRGKEISVSTFRAEDEKGAAPRAFYEKYGFVAGALIEEMNYPNQEYVLHPIGAEGKNRQLAINRMVQEISRILLSCCPSVFLYGSAAMNDFRLGWSDIDILVLTEKEISEEQAKKLVYLRQSLLENEPGNPYYRSFEGGMLSLEAFLSSHKNRTVYWGTSGERVTDRYIVDCFGMTELAQSSVLLYGKDIRKILKTPDYNALYDGVRYHYETIRKYARKTGRDFYSFGWLLDIARCIYTLRTGRIITKTAAAEWAMENHLCPDPEALKIALNVRKNPMLYRADQGIFDVAETFAAPVQRFADVLEEELMIRKGEMTI